MQPQQPAFVKVNCERNRNSRAIGQVLASRRALRDDRNGNRMKASAHKRQVGPTPATIATSTSLWRTTTTRESSAPSIGWPRPIRVPLLILTLILAGGLGTPLATQANHLALGSSSSVSVESREPRHDVEPVPEMTDADRVNREPPPAPSHSQVALTLERNLLNGDTSSSSSNNNNNNGLNVRESLMDLDRVVSRDENDGDGDDDDTDDTYWKEGGWKSKKISPARRLLVRQLTNLIMNHEPETIAARMEGARVRGQMSSESSSSGAAAAKGHTGNNNNHIDDSGKVWAFDEPPSYLVARSGSSSRDAPPSQASPEEMADKYLATSSGQDLELELAGQPNGATEAPANALASNDNGEQLVTCPPDYDDLAAEGGSASNLDAEQQQQLLAGADSSGLLSTPNRSVSGEPSPHSQLRPSLVTQCVHPGIRMIEVITKIITPILFTIIIIVGLLGNIIVMAVILEDRQTERELTPTNLLILDLSLADLLFIIFCIPFTGWDYSVGHWVFGSLWCKFNQYLIVVCALSSIYTLVLMSIDRFMAIVYPIECISYRTSKNTLYAIYIKWIVILLMASPTIAMHGLIDQPMDPHQYACRFLSDQYDALSFQITFFITSYLFPLILIFCLYLSLLNKLWFGTKPHGHKESHKMLESKKKVTWLVAGIVFVFAICWCPIQVMLILMRLKSHKITATYVAIQVFAHTLGYMNSCVNPIVYAFASETFTNSFKRSVFGRFFRMCFCLPAPDDHGRPGYNYHSARPSNATFHNTTSLNHQSILNNNNNNNNGSGSNRAISVYHNHQDNPIIHQRIGEMVGGDESLTCSTKTSQRTNSCQSSCENNFNGKQVVLPLEPRDRGVSPTLGASPSDIVRNRDEQSVPATVATRGDNDQRGNKQPRAEKVLIPRGATISREDHDSRAKLGPPAKQQLVARVVQTGNNPASQRCETACYQQELIGP